jgi:hypothetical protein
MPKYYAILTEPLPHSLQPAETHFISDSSRCSRWQIEGFRVTVEGPRIMDQSGVILSRAKNLSLGDYGCNGLDG